MSETATLEAKDPTDVKDYAIEWGAVLAAEGDAIDASYWATSEPAGLTVTGSPASSISGTKTIVWVSGGTARVTYALANTIETTGGRTHQRSIVIPCLQR